MNEMVFGHRYRVTEKIGSGGMAEVYKAVDETLGRTVAVKVLHPRYAADPGFAARFRQEAQAAANLQSPYIVNIYDWGQDGETYYIVMEYCRGTDLKSIIESKGSLDSRRVAEIGAQVCSALSVAHGYDVIHRDIKPHNIMVAPDGSVKVMDFGIARAGNTMMTQTGSVLGTAHYVSPEQAQGRELKTPSDLYSLGVVLYEAATGTLPFDADTPVAVALKQVNEQPVRPTALNPGILPDLERVIGRALAKDPAKRYATAEDMRRDLLKIVSGEGVSAPALAASAAASTPRADQTQVLTPVGNGAGGGPIVRSVPKRRPVWPWVIAAVLLVLAGLGIAYGLGLFGTDAVAVPELVGQTQPQAEQVIADAGFVLGKVIPANDPTVEEGTVIDQSPVAGASAPKGSTVDITVSQGPAVVEVPLLIGMTDEEAREALIASGLVPKLALEPDDKAEPGTVFKQSPKQGEEVEAGTFVLYYISRGVETVQVPSVKGKTQAEAESTLTQAGFKVSTKKQYHDTVKAGIVIDQNPQGGLSVAKGSKITINVSEGPARIEVPDVIGQSLADATAKLEGLGFKVAVRYDPHANNGTVLEQDPSPGTSAARGSTVSLLVDATPP